MHAYPGRLAAANDERVGVGHCNVGEVVGKVDRVDYRAPELWGRGIPRHRSPTDVCESKNELCGVNGEGCVFSCIFRRAVQNPAVICLLNDVDTCIYLDTR